MQSSQRNISAESNLALLKLIIKLKLVPPGTKLDDSSDTEQLPITFLASKGALNEELAIAAVAQHLGVPVFQVNQSNIEHLVAMVESPFLSRLPLTHWRAYRAIPIEVKSDSITVAFANPLAHEAKTAIEFEIGMPVHVAIAAESQILRVLTKQISPNELFELAGPKDSGPLEFSNNETAGTPSSESSLVGEDIDSPPIIRIVNKIFTDSVEQNASDIHLEGEKDGLLVRIRVDGILRPLLKIPQHAEKHTISRMKLLAGMDISERRKPQDGRFRIKTSFGTRDLRVSTVPAVHGEKIVVRILPTDLSKFDFSALGMDSEMEQQFKRILTGSSRVVLVTGPTGSGKTTTLYTSVLSLRDGKRNIITIEDPIEYRIAGVTQIQVNNKTGLTFAEGLRSILRQDPNVVMVGEIRDHETADIAMQTAQTGHLVLSTFHTNDAPSAITRLRDLGIPLYSIASSIGAIVAQRLVRTVCKECATPIDSAEADKLTALGIDVGNARRGKGCNTCNQTGLSGRCAVYSLLEINNQVRDAIRAGTSEQELAALAVVSGYRTLMDAALRKVSQGATVLEEVERIMGPVEATTAPVVDRASHHDGLTRHKILLVEDDENTRSVLSMVLENELYQVIEAENGQDGLKKVYEETPEIIVCDLMMPKMNGMQLVQRLRGDPRTKHIPVLMLTAAGSEENECNLIACGADDFVAKGGDTRVLLARIQRLIGRIA